MVFSITLTREIHKGRGKWTSAVYISKAPVVFTERCDAERYMEALIALTKDCTGTWTKRSESEMHRVEDVYRYLDGFIHISSASNNKPVMFGVGEAMYRDKISADNFEITTDSHWGPTGAYEDTVKAWVPHARMMLENVAKSTERGTLTPTTFGNMSLASFFGVVPPDVTDEMLVSLFETPVASTIKLRDDGDGSNAWVDDYIFVKSAFELFTPAYDERMVLAYTKEGHMDVKLISAEPSQVGYMIDGDTRTYMYMGMHDHHYAYKDCVSDTGLVIMLPYNPGTSIPFAVDLRFTFNTDKIKKAGLLDLREDVRKAMFGGRVHKEFAHKNLQ